MSDDLSLDDGENERSLNNVVFPCKLLRQFIQLYKELPALWDRNHLSYKLKPKRHEAITTLTELVQQYDPTATRVHVLRKIESLRACVRREHNRVRNSRLTAKSADEIYKPHLWYYDMLSFVFNDDAMNNQRFNNSGPDIKVARDNPSNLVLKFEEEEDEEAREDDDTQFEHQYVDNFQPDYSLATSMVEVSDSSSRQISTFDEDDSSNAKRRRTEVGDEYDAIGINVAAKLRNLQPNMRILAEKLINDVMFQAQLNGLTPSTVITTPDPFKQDPL